MTSGGKDAAGAALAIPWEAAAGLSGAPSTVVGKACRAEMVTFSSPWSSTWLFPKADVLFIVDLGLCRSSVCIYFVERRAKVECSHEPLLGVENVGSLRVGIMKCESLAYCPSSVVSQTPRGQGGCCSGHRRNQGQPLPTRRKYESTRGSCAPT